MRTTAMKTAWARGRRLVFGAALLVGAAAGTARAEEGVEKAIAVSASYGAEKNDTVRPRGGGSDSGTGADGAMLGFTALVSVGPVAVGATLELPPAAYGIGNRTTGGLAGVRLPLSPRLRLLVLGEAGKRTFFDREDFLFTNTVTPSEMSMPYVGGRVGITWLVLKHMDVG